MRSEVAAICETCPARVPPLRSRDPLGHCREARPPDRDRWLEGSGSRGVMRCSTWAEPGHSLGHRRASGIGCCELVSSSPVAHAALRHFARRSRAAGVSGARRCRTAGRGVRAARSLVSMHASRNHGGRMTDLSCADELGRGPRALPIGHRSRGSAAFTVPWRPLTSSAMTRWQHDLAGSSSAVGTQTPIRPLRIRSVCLTAESRRTFSFAEVMS